jgi:hypothetical protein
MPVKQVMLLHKVNFNPNGSLSGSLNNSHGKRLAYDDGELNENYIGP